MVRVRACEAFVLRLCMGAGAWVIKWGDISAVACVHGKRSSNIYCGRGCLWHRRTRSDVRGESGVCSVTCIRSSLGAYMWVSRDM
jgi:hypothetical protein